MRIGMVGLGRMGTAMAERLIERGHQVFGWNRSVERAQGIAGLTVAGSPAAAAAAAEFVIVMVYDEDAVQAVYHGEGGLLSASLTGKTIIDMSTVPPDTMTRMETELAERGGAFVACPVSGTVGPARNGTLLGLLGGPSEVRDRVKPLLADLCDRLQEFDTPGAASAMKLAVNLPLLAFFQALGEAALVTRRFGIPPERFIDIIGNSPGAPPALRMRGEGVIAAMRGKVLTGSAFTLGAVEKDLRLIDEEGGHIGCSLPVTKAVRAAVQEAVRAGWEERDLAALPGFDLRA